jgi:S1-C subfamily serine protease
MIGQTKTDSRRNLMYLGAAAVVLLAGTVAWQVQSTDQLSDDLLADANRRGELTQAQLDSVARVAGDAAERSAALTPAEIAQRFAAAVVHIEFSWKLMHSGLSGQVFHMHIPNQIRTQRGVLPIIDDGRRNIPAYIMVGENQWEPWLTVDRGEGNTPIGVSGGATGFVVKKTGLILTNRHVAANWRAPYGNWGSERQSLGVLLDGNGLVLLQQDGSPIVVPPPSRWIPDETKQEGPKGTLGQWVPQVEYIYASFPKNTIRRAATEAAVSDRHDLALIKIETGQDSLPTLELYDNYDKIAVGDAITVLGYPSVSDEVFAVIKSKDTFNREAQLRVIPDPTLSAGHIGKVLRAADGPANDAAGTYAPSGDRYQLTINSTGAGNSGGPMFDSFGRVIGVFFAGRFADTYVSFSVPIRYALELMNIAPNSP